MKIKEESKVIQHLKQIHCRVSREAAKEAKKLAGKKKDGVRLKRAEKVSFINSLVASRFIYYVN